VHGDDAAEARALSAPDQELLVIEGVQVGLGQRWVDLYTLTLPRRIEAPVAPSATPPVELEPVPLEVCVSGVRAAGGGVVPEPPVLPVLDVGSFGTVPVVGTVLVPVGAMPVGFVGLVVVGTPVVVVPVAGGVPGVVAVGVVLVDGVVVVVGLAAGSVFKLSGSTSSEIGRGCCRVSVVVGVLVLVLELFDRPLAVIWGWPAGVAVVAATGVESGLSEAVGVAALADMVTWAGAEAGLVGAAAACTT
jgi:hypothetical protein